jgi:hypothetical protein
MTTAALEIYDQHRKYQLEEGVFSEGVPAIVDGTIEVKGVFDDSHIVGSKDGGNVLARKRSIRFLVDTVPTYTPKQSTIVIDGITYKMIRDDKDKRGIPVLWLNLT